MRGNRRCRLHGARGGGESGNRNALKHGLFTRESIAERRDLRALEKMLREALEGWG